MKSRPVNLNPWSVMALFVSALFLAPGGLMAQELANPTPETELARKNLQSFVGAYKEVSEIGSTYEQRIIQSEDPNRVEALQQEANQKMSAAVTDHGLSIMDYNVIFKTIESDQTLQKEFMMVLNSAP
jgi:hypothetical protein